MKSKIIVLLLSMLIATLLISGGYGDWHKDLTIKGEIIVKPVSNNEARQAESSLGGNSPTIDLGANQENPLDKQGPTLAAPEQLPENNQTDAAVDQTTIQSSGEAIGSGTSGDTINQAPENNQASHDNGGE